MNPQFESVYPRAPAPYVPAPVPIVIVPLTSNLDDGLVVPMPTFPPKYAFPVVVAPPKIVSPVACPPAPIVEDARARMDDAVSVPLSDGDAEKTRFPVPAS